MNCSELAATITKIALNIGSRPDVNGLDDVVSIMSKDLPEISRAEVVNSIFEATTGHARVTSEISEKLNTLKREAKSDVILRRRINALQSNLITGTVPTPEVRADRAAEVVKGLRLIRDDLRKQVGKSEPAVRNRLADQIESLTERYESISSVPPTKAKPVLSKELERMAFKRDQLQKQIRRKINSLRPTSIWAKAGEPLNLARAILTSLDFSAVLRQGGFVAFGHPIRAAKAMPAMFKAFVSKQSEFAFNKSLEDRPNAPLYARAKLYIASDESLNQQEETFMSRLAGYIPGVAGSQRAYNTFLNKLRADTFDAMVATLSINGEPTMEEAKAVANYINVATGRGGLGKAEVAAKALNTLFFSPRYVASRFQLLAGQPLYGGTARTRKMVATEYARLVIGLGLIYAIGAAAGGELEKDPRSSDFGKLRFGDSRLDLMMGLSQVIVVTSRLLSGKMKSATTDKVTPIRGPKVPYGGTTSSRLVWNFMRSKFAPVPGALFDIADGENVIGEAVTPISALRNMIMPMSFQSTYEVLQEEGIERGSALSLLSIFGAGLSTFRDK